MRKVTIDFNNPADYEYESGGVGTIGDLELFTNFNGYAEELLWLNGSSRWSDEFVVPDFPYKGTSDYLLVNDPDRFNVANDFCFSTWMTSRAPFGSSDTRTMFSLESPTRTVSFQIGTSSDFIGVRLIFEVIDDGSSFIKILSGPLDVISGPWYNLVVTRRYGKVRLFLNGRIMGSGMFGEALTNMTMIRVGTKNHRGQLLDFHQGYLDEVMFDSTDYWWDDEFLVPIEPFSVSYPFIHLQDKVVLDSRHDIDVDLTTIDFAEGERHLEFPQEHFVDVSLVEINSTPYAPVVSVSTPYYHFPLNDLEGNAQDIVANKEMEFIGNVHQRKRSLVNNSSTLFEYGGTGIIRDFNWKPADSWSIEFWYCYENHRTVAREMNHDFRFGNSLPLPQTNPSFIYLSTAQSMYVFGHMVGNLSFHASHYDGNWHHIVLTFDHTTEALSYFLDNEVVSITTAPGWRVSFDTGICTLGQKGGLFGLYNDLVFYERSLPAEEVETHYTAGINTQNADIWWLDEEGNVIERHDAHSITYEPPKIQRVMEGSLLSVSTSGKSWSRLTNFGADLYEQAAFPTLELERILELDFYYPADYVLGELLPKITELPTLKFSLDFLQGMDDPFIPVLGKIVDENLKILAVAGLIGNPEYNDLIFPSLTEVDEKTTFNILTFHHKLGNNYFIGIDRNETHDLTLNQTNPVSSVDVYDFQQSVLFSWDGNNHTYNDGEKTTTLNEVGTVTDPQSYPISHLTFEVHWTQKPQDDDRGYQHFWIFNTGDDHLRVYYYRDNNYRRFYLCTRRNGTNANTYVNVAESSTHGYKCKLVHHNGVYTATIIALSTSASYTMSGSVSLNFPPNLRLQFQISSWSSYWTPGTIGPDIYFRTYLEGDVKNISEGDAHYANASNIELEFDDIYFCEEDVLNPFPVTPAWRYALMDVVDEKGEMVMDGIIHIHYHNEMERVRGFCKISNGEINPLVDVYGESIELAYLNFDNGRMFLRSVYEGDNGTNTLKDDFGSSYQGIIFEEILTSPDLRGELSGVATYSVDDGYIQLTPNNNNNSVNGQITYDGYLDTVSTFVAEFDFWIGGGNGETLYFYYGTDGPVTNPYSSGNHFIVALEEYQNRVTLFFNGVRLVYYAHSTLDNSTWRKIKISVTDGVTFNVEVDGVLVISHTTSPGTLTGTKFGLGAISSGSRHNYHRVRKFILYGHKEDYVYSTNEKASFDFSTPDTLVVYDSFTPSETPRKTTISAILGSEPVVHVGNAAYAYQIHKIIDDEPDYRRQQRGTGNQTVETIYREDERNYKEMAIVPAPLQTDKNSPLIYLPLKNGNLNNRAPRHTFLHESAFVDDNDFTLTEDKDGNPDSAILLQGKSLKINIDKMKGASAFTISFWIRDFTPSSDTSWRYGVYAKPEQRSWANFYFRFRPDRYEIRYSSYHNMNTEGYIYGVSPDFTDKWSHVIIRFQNSGDRFYLYRNTVSASRSENWYAHDYPLNRMKYLAIGLENNAYTNFAVHDVLIFDKELNSTERNRVYTNPSYYDRDNAGGLFAGTKKFNSQDQDVEVLLNDALIIREKPLIKESLIEIDYDLGSAADVDRFTDQIEGTFPAIGEYPTDRTTIYDSALRVDTSRQIRLYYDYLGIIDKTLEITPMRVGAL